MSAQSLPFPVGHSATRSRSARARTAGFRSLAGTRSTLVPRMASSSACTRPSPSRPMSGGKSTSRSTSLSGRIYRPEQLIAPLPEGMRVLTSPSDCGAVTLALPQDVQAEAYDYPAELFPKRVWLIRRGQPDVVSFERAVAAIRGSRRPLIVAGGGVLMSEASRALADFASQTGIAVAETQAGKGSLAYDHPQCMGAIGATGTLDRKSTRLNS